MKSNNAIKVSLKELYNQLLDMTAPQVQRLYDLAYSAIHPAYLQRVIEQLPLTLQESEIYAKLSSSLVLAVMVKDMAKARLKGLGEWHGKK